MAFAKTYIVSEVQACILKLRSESGVVFSKDANVLSWRWMPVALHDGLHLGQAFSLVVQDFLLRLSRQTGQQITSQLVIHQSPFLQHKQFLSQTVVSKSFLYDTHYYLRQEYDRVVSDFLNLGLYFDQKAVPASFFESVQLDLRAKFSELHAQQFIVKNKEIVYRNLSLSTLVGKDDLLFQTEKRKIYRIRYFIDTKKHFVVVTTSRPDLIFADVALAVNPLDKRYKKFIGKKAIIPIINKAIPVVADPRIDMTKNYGLMRVCPGHDVLSLGIAKTHNLPLDVYAIGFDGNFTELAGEFVGKPVVDFFDNIVQYLDDISNLESQYRDDVVVAYCKKTGVELQCFAMEQWFLVPQQRIVDMVSDALAFGQIEVYPTSLKESLPDLILGDLSLCISRHYKFGARLPLVMVDGESIVLSQERLLAGCADFSGEHGTVLGLVLLQLYWDGRLSANFGVDEVLDILFGPSLENGDISTLGHYLQLMKSDLLVCKHLRKEFDTLDRIVQDVWQAEFALDKQKDFLFAQIVDILDQQVLCKHKGHVYTFDFEFLFGKVEIKLEDVQADTSLYVVLADVLAQNKNASFSYQLVGSDAFLLTIQKMLFEMAYLKFSHLRIVDTHPLVLDKKRKKKMGLDPEGLTTIRPLLDQYGADALRIALLSRFDVEQDFVVQLDSLSGADVLLKKLWNASRFVAKELETCGFVFSEVGGFAQLESLVQEHMGEYDAFDYWILQQLKEFVEEGQIVNAFEQIPGWVNKVLFLLEYVYCGRYLELYKKHALESSHLVLIYVLMSLLRIVHPVMPFLTEKLRQMLGGDSCLVHQTLYFGLRLPAKNYRVHIFLDIIKNFVELKSGLVKKHEEVLLYVRASLDFLAEVEQYQEILQQFLKARDIVYLKKHEDLPGDLPVAYVLDIELAVQSLGVMRKEDQLLEMQESLAEKQKYLQYLRALISSAISSGRRDFVVEKEADLEAVKKEIDELEFAISKLRMSS